MAESAQLRGIPQAREYYNGFPKEWRKHGRPRRIQKGPNARKIVLHIHKDVFDELVKKCQELHCNRDEYVERLLVNHVICGDVHEGTLHILKYYADQKGISLSQAAYILLRDKLHQMGQDLGILR